MFHFNAVQTAIYEALLSDPALVSLRGNRIYDDAGHNAAFPYQTLGESTVTPEDCLIETGAQASITIHSWSRQKGSAECGSLMEATIAALDNKRQPVAGFQWVECRVINGQTLRDLDGVTRHGILTFRIRTFDAAGV